MQDKKPQSIKQKEAGHSKFDVQEETNDRRIFRNMTNTSFLHSSDAKEQLGQPLDTTQFLWIFSNSSENKKREKDGFLNKPMEPKHTGSE